jgi:hypothetical protein
MDTYTDLGGTVWNVNTSKQIQVEQDVCYYAEAEGMYCYFPCCEVDGQINRRAFVKYVCDTADELKFDHDSLASITEHIQHDIGEMLKFDHDSLASITEHIQHDIGEILTTWDECGGTYNETLIK